MSKLVEGWMEVNDHTFWLPPERRLRQWTFVMTTATDHKNNLNSSTLKKNYARTLRVETIANSAGDTVEVAIVAQPSTGFLNGRFYPDGSPRKTPKTA